MLLENSKEEVVLRVTTDNKLTGDSYIKSIFWKPGQKFGALLKITNYLNSCKKKAYFQGNDKILVHLLSFNQDVLLKKI